MAKIELIRELSKWELRREERYSIERQFNNWSGLIYSFETHIPYTHYEYIEWAMDEADMYRRAYHGKSLAVFSDALNLDLFSHYYKKNPSEPSAIQEMEDFINLLKECEKHFTKTIFLLSNHDLRIWKCIMNSSLEKKQAKELYHFVKTYSELFKESGLNRVICVNSYLLQIGDAVFSHFENNSAVPGSVARWVVQYLTPRMKKPWSVCYQAHTHGQIMVPIDRKVVIETGACCDSLDYWRNGKMQGKGRMTTQGYGRGLMKNGKVDLNECRPIICGWEDYL